MCIGFFDANLIKLFTVIFKEFVSVSYMSDPTQFNIDCTRALYIIILLVL